MLCGNGWKVPLPNSVLRDPLPYREAFLLATNYQTQLSSEEVLRFVVMPDEQGRYHFDTMGNDHLPEYLGYLVGYLSGPLAALEARHDTEPLSRTLMQEA